MFLVGIYTICLINKSDTIELYDSRMFVRRGIVVIGHNKSILLIYIYIMKNLNVILIK